MLIKPTAVNAKHEDAALNSLIARYNFASPALVQALVVFAEDLINAYADKTNQSASEQANFQDTPVRAVKGWLEILSRTLHNPSRYPELRELHSVWNQLGEAVQRAPQEPLSGFTLRGTAPVAPISLTSLGIDPSQIKARQREYIAKHLISKTRLIYSELPAILETGFPMENTTHDPGLVTQGAIQIRSMCPHHLLPVIYEAFVSYLPKRDGYVLGLSKLARLSVALGMRPVLQEQLTNDIADVLHHSTLGSEEIALPQIETEGSAVQLIGKHTCMSCRGAQQSALTLTTSLRGAYAKNERVRSEFYQSIQSLRYSTLNDTVKKG